MHNSTGKTATLRTVPKLYALDTVQSTAFKLHAQNMEAPAMLSL